MIHTQISIVDEISRRYDDVIASWGVWRDAQTSDEHKELVDEIFAMSCRQLENIARAMGMDVLPF